MQVSALHPNPLNSSKGLQERAYVGESHTGRLAALRGANPGTFLFLLIFFKLKHS